MLYLSLIFRSLIFRCLIVVTTLVTLIILPARAAQPAINPGEILFSGLIETVTQEQASFTFRAATFTLPNGRTNRIDPPKTKSVQINSDTVMEMSGGGRKLTSADLKTGSEVTVIGRDLGTGKPLPARVVVIQVNAPEVRAGEIGLNGHIEGTLGGGTFVVGAMSTTAPGNSTTELDEREAWTVAVASTTIIRGATIADQELTVADLKLRDKIVAIGKVTGEKILRARIVLIQDDYVDSSHSVGKQAIDATVAQLATQSDALRVRGFLDRAMPLLEQALRRARLVEDRTAEGMMLNRLGNLYSSLGRTAKATEAFEQALAISRERKDRVSEVITLSNLGAHFHTAGDEKKAIALLEAATLITDTGEPAAEVQPWLNLATIYGEVKEARKSLAAFGKALPLLKAIGDEEREAHALTSMITLYMKVADAPKALQTAQRLLPIRNAIHDKNQQALCLFSIGLAYRANNQPLEALKYLRQSSQAYGEGGDEASRAAVQEVITKLESAPRG